MNIYLHCGLCDAQNASRCMWAHIGLMSIKFCDTFDCGISLAVWSSHFAVMSSESQVQVENVSVEQRGSGKFVNTKKRRTNYFTRVLSYGFKYVLHAAHIAHDGVGIGWSTQKFRSTKMRLLKNAYTIHVHTVPTCCQSLKKYVQKVESEVIDRTEFVAL